MNDESTCAGRSMYDRDCQRSPNRFSAANCARWAIESSRRDRAIMSMTRRLSRHSKKNPKPPGEPRGGHRQASRTVVPGRSPNRSKEQNHATLGRTRDAPFCLERPENRLGLYLRSHLSRSRQGGRTCPALLQHRGHGVASSRNRARGGARRPRRSVRGSGRMARQREADSSRKHHARPPAVQVARAQSRGKHLTIYARQLALEPYLRQLQRHPRSLLLQLEQIGRAPVAHHVNRNAAMGAWVHLLGTWYYAKVSNYESSAV